MESVTERRCLSKNNKTLKRKSILIDLVTITNPCGNSSSDSSARGSGYTMHELANSKNKTYRGTFPAI